MTRMSRRDGAEMMDTEVAILKAVDHPNVISMTDMFETSEHLYLVMELCVAGWSGRAT